MLNDAAVIIGSNAVKAAITHMQLHSTNVGGAWGSNGLATRTAVSGSTDADGDITWTTVVFTGLAANQAVGGVSYWGSAGSGNPATGGTNFGGSAVTGDATANSAGEYTLTLVSENTTAT